jgi:iron transport multicopper oxidase
VVQRIGPYGGVWSKPAVWPGNGGWVYLPTASGGTSPGGSNGTFDVYQANQDGSGNPTLARVGQATDPFGFGSSAPVVTSDGTASGSALVWIIWSADGTGVGGQLRAYDAVPTSGTLNLRYSAPIGQANKFTPPGVAGGRIYVATRDGHVKAFGAPINPILTAPTVDFGLVTVGGSVTQPVVFTAARAATVTSVSAQGDFTVLSTQPATPAALTAGQTITANVSFTPTKTGVRAAALVADTDQGPASTSLTGTGQLLLGKLQSAPTALSFGGTAIGRTASGAVTFTNVGGMSLTVQAVNPPSAPFSVTGAPAPGTGLGPGQSITLTLAFAPTQTGTFTDSITVVTDVGSVQVPMSGSGGVPGNLQITPGALDFGQVSVGMTATRNFTIQNTGGVRITLTKSKPPGSDIGFGADSQLSEGTTVDPGASQSLQVHFTPAKVGPAQDQWVLTADDGNGPQTLLLTGSGGMSRASGGCGTPGPLALWPLLTLLPWALRRRRA